jgi:protein-disulfide isomerase
MRASKVVLVVVLVAAAAFPLFAKKNKDQAAPQAAASQPAATSSRAGTDVVATVAGQPITNADIEAQVGSRLSQLRMQMQQQEYQLKSQAVDQIVRDRLIEAEAKARGVSTADLLKAEIEDKVAAPTKEEIDQAYERNKARLGTRTRDEAGPEIERQIRLQKAAERRNKLMDELEAKADVQIFLDPPRIAVNIPASAPSRGPAGAPVTVVEFSDFQCGFCKRAHDTVEQLVAAYPNDVRLVYMDYPLPMHNRAGAASEAARCAGEQGKYWEYSTNLMKVAGDLSDDNLKQRATDVGLDASAFGACMASNKHEAAVQSDYAEGGRVGVSGTPTFFINGRMIVGAKPLEEFKGIVEDELRRSKAKRASN